MSTLQQRTIEPRHRRRSLLASGMPTPVSAPVADRTNTAPETAATKTVVCPQCLCFIGATDDEQACVICKYSVYGADNVTAWNYVKWDNGVVLP